MRVGLWRKLSAEELMAFELWCWRILLRVPWTAKRSNQSILKEMSPRCSLEGMMPKLKLQYFGHLMWRVDSLERLWCWEGLRAGGKWDDRGWDGRMASPTRWTWVWVNSRCWWWRGRPGVLQFMGSQRVRHDWATELNWPDTCIRKYNVSTFRLYYSKIWQRMVYSICQLVYPLLQNSYIPPSKTYFFHQNYIPLIPQCNSYPVKGVTTLLFLSPFNLTVFTKSTRCSQVSQFC